MSGGLATATAACPAGVLPESKIECTNAMHASTIGVSTKPYEITNGTVHTAQVAPTRSGPYRSASRPPNGDISAIGAAKIVSENATNSVLAPRSSRNRAHNESYTPIGT